MREALRRPVRSRPVSALLFSVQITDALLYSPSATSMVLSAISLPITWCHRYPSLQQSFKVSRRSSKGVSWHWALFGLFALAQPASIFALPGTNHVLVNEPSLDSFRQQALQTTVVDNITRAVPASSFALPTTDDAKSLPTTPYCFAFDTDSVPYVLDTGANRMIVNNPKLLRDFRPTQGGVKGVGGTLVSIQGTGVCRIPLHTDNGNADIIDIHNAIYVPTSPFNLVPPQLLIASLKQAGFIVKWFKHNEQSYMIKVFEVE
jgi:hypothetical protein